MYMEQIYQIWGDGDKSKGMGMGIRRSSSSNQPHIHFLLKCRKRVDWRVQDLTVLLRSSKTILTKRVQVVPVSTLRRSITSVATFLVGCCPCYQRPPFGWRRRRGMHTLTPKHDSRVPSLRSSSSILRRTTSLIMDKRYVYTSVLI